MFPVDFASHKLKTDADVALPKKSYQRPMTEPQRKFFNNIINDMETVGIIQAVSAGTEVVGEARPTGLLYIYHRSRME